MLRLGLHLFMTLSDFSIRPEILYVSDDLDELSDNTLEVPEPVGRKLSAFPSLEISSNPFFPSSEISSNPFSKQVTFLLL